MEEIVSEGLRLSAHFARPPASERAVLIRELHIDRRNITVDINGDTVTVHVTTIQSLAILGVAGAGPVTIHAIGSAIAQRGITSAGS